MTNAEILDWLKTEFSPVLLATPDETVLQTIRNAKRYWNTHSAYPIVNMFPLSNITTMTGGSTSTILQLTPDYKNVQKILPATNPDWVLQNYPMWSLLGISVIDNLTSDLINLAESYKNYRYYMGADFNWKFQKSENPVIGGKAYLTSIPSNTASFAVIGSKRIIDGEITLDTTGISGTAKLTPIIENSVVLTNGTQTFTDNETGVLTPDIGTNTGTIDYETGVWSINGWSGGLTTGTISYNYSEDITSEFILDWILSYTKALVMQVEGNTLRKVDSINIKNDGQRLVDEGKESMEKLQEKLTHEGRWTTFCRRF